MATSSNPSLDWLRQECQSIGSRRFHIFEPVESADLRYEHAGRSVDLGSDYADFLKEFGYARLFTDHNDAPVVSVYPLKAYRRHTCDDGKTYVGFGFRAGQSVYFDEATILAGGSSQVYLVNRKSGRVLNDGFSAWLDDAYQWAKAKHSPAQWRRIVAGPAPFTAEELSVVEARRRFEWAHVGFSNSGDAIFRVANHSSRRLPWLSIGVQGKGGSVLVGGAWLDVGKIGPGETAFVEAHCYKDRISPDQLETHDLPEPIPEKRECYREFERPV